MSGNYVCHIDPKLVAEHIETKCHQYNQMRATLRVRETKHMAMYAQDEITGHTHQWRKKPNMDYIDPMVDEWIRKAREYYANARILHVAEVYQNPENFLEEGFYLNYDGDDKNLASGPFYTLDEAEAWFLRGGR